VDALVMNKRIGDILYVNDDDRKMNIDLGCLSGGDEKCKNILVGKPERKRSLRRPWCRWEDNIRIHLRAEPRWFSQLVS